jgi:hypothetical protein
MEVAAVFSITIVPGCVPDIRAVLVFAAVPLTIVLMITVILLPFAIMSARYHNGEWLRSSAGDRKTASREF